MASVAYWSAFCFFVRLTKTQYSSVSTGEKEWTKKVKVFQTESESVCGFCDLILANFDLFKTSFNAIGDF